MHLIPGIRLDVLCRPLLAPFFCRFEERVYARVQLELCMYILN